MKERTAKFDGRAPSRLIKNESKEDYLESILLLQRELERPIRSFELSEQMNLSKPSVCRAVNILRDEELVEMDGDYYISLTEKRRRGSEARLREALLLQGCSYERRR